MSDRIEHLRIYPILNLSDDDNHSLVETDDDVQKDQCDNSYSDDDLEYSPPHVKARRAIHLSPSTGINRSDIQHATGLHYSQLLKKGEIQHESISPASLNHINLPELGGGIDCCQILLGVILAFVVGCSVSFFAYYTPFSQSQDQSFTGEKLKLFEARLDDLQRSFVGQNRKTFVKLNSVAKLLFSTEFPSPAPAVISVLVRRDKQKMAECFARKIGTIFAQVASGTQSAEYLHVSGSDFGSNSEENFDSLKFKFDNVISDALKNNTRSVMIENIEQLVPSVALMLHSYCDTANAPRKDVTFVFTIGYDSTRELTLDAVKSAESLADAILTKWWLASGLDKDSIGALLTRVATTVIAVNDGKVPDFCD